MNYAREVIRANGLFCDVLRARLAAMVAGDFVLFAMWSITFK